MNKYIHKLKKKNRKKKVTYYNTEDRAEIGNWEFAESDEDLLHRAPSFSFGDRSA